SKTYRSARVAPEKRSSRTACRSEPPTSGLPISGDGVETNGLALLRTAADNLVHVFEHDTEVKIFQAEHPTQSRLVGGMVLRVVKIADVLSSPGWLPKFSQLAHEISAIATWFPATISVEPLSESEKNNEAARLSRLNWDFTGITAYLNALGKKRRGRPATKKHLTVLAHEGKALHKWSWPRLADKVCMGVNPDTHCELRRRNERHKHDTPCCQALR